MRRVKVGALRVCRVCRKKFPVFIISKRRYYSKVCRECRKNRLGEYRRSRIQKPRYMVKCTRCGLEQSYIMTKPHNIKRQKKCIRCGVQFMVGKQT